MKLCEFEAKAILNHFGVPVPHGKLAKNPDEVAQFARLVAKQVFLKAQVTVSGRAKGGGILEAPNASEAVRLAAKLFGHPIQGLPVNSLLIEERLNVKAQYYLSIALDRHLKAFIVLASRSGGVDIEEVARISPSAILRVKIDPLKGLTGSQIQDLIRQLQFSPTSSIQFGSILKALFAAAVASDAELVEINPLVETESGDLIAADARMIIDDNALFRHAEFTERNLRRDEDTPREAEARRRGLTYVDLDGNIGVIGNGAGLMMASLDMVYLYGGRPANFLDIGGGAQAEVVKDALLFVMDKPEVKVVLINILGGITRCDVVAEGVVSALEAADSKKLVLVRMMGTNEFAGQEILRRNRISYFPDMEQAALAAVAAGVISSDSSPLNSLSAPSDKAE
jgi:succinyl-CoA synthetase beta subunit